MARASLRYQGHRDPQTRCAWRCEEVGASRCASGIGGLTVLLRREGWRVKAKRIYRLSTEDGLTVRTKHRTKAAGRARVPQPGATAPNQRWSMDFMRERVADGRWFRILTVVDQCTRECLGLVADQSLTGEKVAEALAPVVMHRGAPRSITVDKTRQRIASRVMMPGLPMDPAGFYSTGKPVENGLQSRASMGAYGRVLERGRVLYARDVRAKFARWQEDYNFTIPHSALRDQPRPPLRRTGWRL